MLYVRHSQAIGIFCIILARLQISRFYFFIIGGFNLKHLYIDESGSMTVKHSNSNGFFVFAILDVIDQKKLRRVFKRYISRNIEELRKYDKDNKMFRENKFYELKGQCLPPHLKIDFANYLAKSNLFKVFIGRIDNKSLKDDKLYQNTARAFNYVLKCVLTYLRHVNKLPYDDYIVQIDERNTKTFSINSLEDYLFLELVIEEKLVNDISVQYFRSEDNSYIQIADFFANLYFSSLHNKKMYKGLMNKLKTTGYLIDDFVFPIVK